MTIRVLRVWLLAVLLASGACDSLTRATGAISEMFAVQRAVQARVGSAPVRINVSNGSYLTISIVNSPLGQLPADQKKAKARELAKVAYDAYGDRARLRAVHVVFVVQKRYLVFSYTDGTDFHAFEAVELRNDAAAAPVSPT